MSRDASDGNALYSGSASYREVEKLLYGRGRGLSIVSPYLSRYYVRKLAGIARRKRIRLITTAQTAKEERELVRYLGRRGASIWLKALIALLLFIALSALVGFWFLALMAMQALALDSMLLTISAARRKPNIEVRFVRGVFVHEKLYISEKQAITGSANLTWSGMHKNIEHLEITRNPDRIRALADHFQELWERAGA
jgi:phosphatidylserine/phosphatidylglycerophosphate/cardiolipin synthase-like enzyme